MTGFELRIMLRLVVLRNKDSVGKKHEITIFSILLHLIPIFLAVLKNMKLLCHICCWEQAAAVNSEELH